MILGKHYPPRCTSIPVAGSELFRSHFWLMSPVILRFPVCLLSAVNWRAEQVFLWAPTRPNRWACTDGRKPFRQIPVPSSSEQEGYSIPATNLSPRSWFTSPTAPAASGQCTLMTEHRIRKAPVTKSSPRSIRRQPRPHQIAAKVTDRRARRTLTRWARFVWFSALSSLLGWRAFP